MEETININKSIDSKRKMIIESPSYILRAIMFVLGTYLILILSILLVLAIAGGLIGAFFLIVYIFMELFNVTRMRVPIGFVVALCVGAYYGVSIILKSIYYSFFRTNKGSFQPALLLNLHEHKELQNLIFELCTKMRVKKPSNILLHSEPTFYVTEGKIRTFDRELSGRTLAIGVPLLGYLTTNEFRAILSHEFAHFSGKDTLYSKIIHPVYLSTINSIQRLQEFIDYNLNNEDRSTYSLPLIIPNFLLKFYVRKFELMNCRISRIREHRADIIAEEICGGKAFKEGLSKVYSISEIFNILSNKHIYELYKEGKIYTNYYKYFRSIREYINEQSEYIISNKLRECVDDLDTHPVLSDRIELIKSDDNKYNNNKLAETLINNLESYEEELTEIYTHYSRVINGW